MLALDSGAPAASSPSPADYFLKIQGFEGEAEDGSIALAGFAWNTLADVGRFVPYTPASQAGLPSYRQTASGSATGRRMHKPFTILKAWDKDSARLLEACADGTRIGDVEVWSREDGQATLRFTLKDAIISSYSLARLTGSDGGVGDLSESISFTFASVAVAPAEAAAATTVNSSKSNSSE
ncbi:MAG: type VI secretion system tube protein Hcp [Gemmatimonadota bacterium]